MSEYCTGQRWLDLSPDDKTRRINFNMTEEEDIFTRSAQSFIDRLESDPTENKPTQDVIKFLSGNLSILIKDNFINKQQSGSKDGSADSLVIQLGPDALAILTVQSIFTCAILKNQGGARASGVASYLGTMLRLVAELKQVRTTNRGAWVLAEKAKKSKWNKRTLDAFIKKHGDYRIKSRQVFKFAGKLLWLAKQAGIVDIVSPKIGKANLQQMVLLSADVSKAITLAANDFLGSNKLLYRPMVVPPIKHTIVRDGGVHTEMLRKAVIRSAKTYWKDGEFRTDFRKSVPSQQSLDALNALMSTEWSVNARVLSVMRLLYHEGTGRCNMPKYEPLDARPDYSGLSLTDDEKRAMYDEFYGRANDRLRMSVRLALASQLHQFGFFYHVWTNDFRGRCYTTTDLLSPQSGDQDKALIHFANPIKQTEHGLYWLKVHVANCFGIDKVSFEDRVQWVEDNMKMLSAINDDPVNTLELWEDDAKKKNTSFQRIAAVFELFRKDGLTQLPVNIDGSCNGIQHWAAISRDPVIGRMVNLLPGSKPNDAYAYVAGLIAQIFEDNRVNDEWADIFASYWEGDVKKLRKVVKRSVMTDPYGVTREGIRTGLLSDGHLDWIPLEGRQRGRASSALAGYIVQAMDGFLGVANQGKNWLRDVATQASDKKQHLLWTTPSGLRVKHEYYPEESIQLSVERLAKAGNFQLSLAEYDQDGLDKRGQVNGIAPNYIHSLDAAHMVATILDCSGQGIVDFSMIHDSYGVHAPLIPTLREATKRQFIVLHQDNPMQRVKQEFEELLEVKLPDLPPQGDLDLNKVMESEYFFH